LTELHNYLDYLAPISVTILLYNLQVQSHGSVHKQQGVI
jgi:hypothetical protein